MKSIILKILAAAMSSVLLMTSNPVIQENDNESINNQSGGEDAEENEDASKNEDEIIVSKEENLKLIMVGDILMHVPVIESGKLEDGSYSYYHLFDNTTDLIKEADIAIVNEEVMLGGVEMGLSGYPAFNSPHEVADALAYAYFDVVCHATNHALDKGEKGILSTLDYWRDVYPEMYIAGIHDSEEDAKDNIVYIEKKGIKIAILNYTYGTNGIPFPQGKTYLVDTLNEASVVSDIKNAKEKADFVIVCPHWGTEYRLTPDGYQKKWAQIFADNGVDLVIGTHPHVIEPKEWVESSDGSHSMLCYYSLGNFVNATGGYGEGVANRMLGAMAEVDLLIKDGNVSIKEAGEIPLVSHLDTSEKKKISVYPLEDYSDELANSNEIIRQDRTFSKDYIWSVWNKVFPDYKE